MSTEQFLAGTDCQYKALPSSLAAMSKSLSFRQHSDLATSTHPIFDELPNATIVSVSRPDASDITPLLLNYSIEVQYKQFKWRLQKKATQVIYLHLSLKKRAIIEEFQEKQEQVKEWLQYIGLGDYTAIMHDDGFDDDAVHFHRNEGSSRNRCVPSRAALSVIRPSLGRQQAITDWAKVAMQDYLNLFLSNVDIVNSLEVCKFLEVSKLSFLQEYGPKMKEGFVLVKHLPNIVGKDSERQCLPCQLFSFCSNNWQKVWAVLKPGFLAFLEDPFGTELLDIVVFDILPDSMDNSNPKVHLAYEIKEQNPIRCGFRVCCGNRSINLRTSSSNKVKDWVSAINDSVQKPSEGWCRPHRYGSFSPPRGLTEDGSEAQWFIDGRAAFEAIASAIENAKSEILITGWWLCPELYLRRPFPDHSSSRLDALLEAKAKKGVQIYVLLYKEVSLALKINSSYSKGRLLNIHENVRVLRYPDHLSTGIYFWSHHEKIVVVDYHICFIGGLDLCFGRYDTMEHKVGDYPSKMWPGKDYYNPRESEPNCWEDIMKDELNRGKNPRMPWHDVQCALWGPPCRDIARHFVHRWNHAKRNKAPNQQAIPLLIPRHHRVIPRYMARCRELNIPAGRTEQPKSAERQDSFSPRSRSPDVPLLLPKDSLVVDDLDVNELTDQLSKYHYHPIDQSVEFKVSSRNYKVEPTIHDVQMKSAADDRDFTGSQNAKPISRLVDSCTDNSDERQYSQEKNNLDVSTVGTSDVGPRTSCHCQILRSVSQWSAGTSQPEESIHRAYCSLIEKAKHFIYIENQFFISGLKQDNIIQNRVLEALYMRILQAHMEQKCFRVIIVIPLLPGFQGGLDDGGAATVRAIMHWQYRTICRGESSLFHNLRAKLGPSFHDYVSIYGLRTYGRLYNDGPISTSQVYVHSKLMIVDDCIALIGSSNINDRSLLGSRDSEIGVVIEDKEFLDSAMDAQPWRAGKFTRSLRLSLWSEHLGLHAGEVSQIHDPISDISYKDLWRGTAQENTMIYEEVFGCVPSDRIHSRGAFRQKMSQLREKIGYTTIDLGIAPLMVESYEDGKVKQIDPMEKLKFVRGFVVCFPLEFMREEKNLRPMFHEGEFYAAPEVFY